MARRYVNAVAMFGLRRAFVGTLMFACIAAAPPVGSNTKAHPHGGGVFAATQRATDLYALGVMDGSPGALRALGAGFTRVGAHWGRVEPTPGVYLWADTDAAVVPLSTRGINMVFGIRAISPWGSYCAQALSGVRADKLTEFQAFVQAAVERYDGDGIADAPGLGATPVKVWQVENQWITATFFRDSSNCTPPARLRTPEKSGDPVLAANEYVLEYQAVVQAARSADAEAVIGPGNIPVLAADAAVFCEGSSGHNFTQNILHHDGALAKTVHFTRRQVCDAAGANPHNIKRWVRYWSVVLNTAMPRIKTDVDFVDIAHYGRYQDIERRNEWLVQQIGTWGFEESPPLVGWESGGPDWRYSVPSPDWRRSAGYDLPKRIAVALGTGTNSFAWFHNRFEPRASAALRHSSLIDETGRPSPAYWNFKLFARAISGANSVTFQRLRSAGPGRGIYLVRFHRADGHQIIIAWADAGAHAAVPVNHAAVTIVPFAGMERPPRRISTARGAPGARAVLVQLSERPLMIRD